jgi:hypothetical protein
MGGQVLGGGVIVLVAALLWLVYLLPSWHSRRQYDAAERNAVRLNQAIRVLAETSETPDEVRLELTARTALAQQKLARQALAEQEALARRASAERHQAALEQARLDLEQARAERAAARRAPDVRRARARRRVRLAATLLGLAGLAIAGWGVWQIIATGAQLFVWVGAAVTALSLLVIGRMSRVAARAVNIATAQPIEHSAAAVQDVALEEARRGWSPRELPRPLTASAGSRAAALLDAEEAREALRQSALEESLRQQVEAQRPPSIDTARVTRAKLTDDAEIEAHVRDLLARRAAGQ